ncbi:MULTISPECIES: UDP-glucose dehydrogenase family protein [unclassified Corallococcus]|uniref:UDP-glucose dehydrogenase family protein n=1 Tax=unclassified Corallococcus TaxID=2685029 RepID=UPI001A8F9FE6|nr:MULTISPECIES: UDP-glucose/GDP-mannose dehydrogenase family protein [unclassified Corallococcus]MBN9688217.1 UDP-glucose/GDP-mannose dehydrogenase family protein [Corallococcus sp. NCSPR001]WAS87977.1 UDP-glucose/GDP-mannose dehydrogenase family protein [Corallococcus sp. NCRR]
MRIAIIGSGYVGLVAGTCFADSGNDVACVDIDERKIRMLQDGQVPIYEPGLEELIKKNVKEKRLTFTTNLAEGVQNAQAVFIAVGTPEGESGEADLQYVLAAAQAVGRAMKQYTVVVDKSTVPVGTADKVREAIAKVTDVEFDVVSNPEFLKEGAALDDFFKPDRVVIGADTERARTIMGELYAPFVRTENPILFMDTRSAELTKYAANAMLATRISFMNDISALCEKVGADVDFVRKGLGADKRIGYPFLFPGVGYGGSCFPKDVKALVTTAREYGLELDLLRAVERTNERQKKLLVSKAVKHYGSLEGKKFGVWGLAFKPKTDDMREAPSIEVIEGLIGKGASVIAHDPVAAHAAKRVFGDRIRYAELPYDALEGVDGLFVVTEWNEFRHPDFARMKSLMKTPVVFDGRNIFQPARMREQGFTYFGIGRNK